MNKTVKFTSGTDATLTISVQKGKKDIIVSARQKEPNGEEMKVIVGCRSYHDLNEAGQAEAEAKFAELLKDARDQGWKQTAIREPKEKFTKIPPAPGAKKKNGK